MFNAAPFNGAGFNAGSGGVRVIFAAALLAAAGTVAADGTKMQMSQAGFLSTWDSGSLYAASRKRASGVNAVTAWFEVGHPRDLRGAREFEVAASFEPAYSVSRAGATDMQVAWSTQKPIPIQTFETFGEFLSVAALEAHFGIRHAGFANQVVTAVFEPLPHVRHGGAADGVALSTASGFMNVAYNGRADFIGVSQLYNSGSRNGEQEGYSVITARALLEPGGERGIRGLVNAGVAATWTLAEPDPGRGNAPSYGDVTATFLVESGAFLGVGIQAVGTTRFEVDHTVNHAGRVEFLPEGRMGPVWRRVRTAEALDVPARATFDATGKYRYAARVASNVAATMDEGEWRLAFQGVSDLRGVTELELNVWVIKGGFAEMLGGGSVLMNRVSINATQAASGGRGMIVAFEDRALLVPFENRTMVAGG